MDCMQEFEGKSQVARDMARIDLELEAADRALHGYAITARHDFIIARAQRGAERILRLVDEGKHEEAQALMNTDNWGVTDEDEQKGSKKEAGEKRKENKKSYRGNNKRKKGKTTDEPGRGA